MHRCCYKNQPHKISLSLVSTKKRTTHVIVHIIKHLDDNINKVARHLLASLRELKVRKLVVTRDTERGAL